MFRASVTYKGPLEQKVDGWNDAVKGALGKAVQFWHQKDAPQHFTRAGSAKYRYELRGRKYEQQKLKKYGSSEPLVFSGATRRSVLQTVRISATSKGAKGSMSASNRALNLSTARGHPNMREELLRVLPSEAEELAKVVDVELTGFLNQETPVVTKVL